MRLSSILSRGEAQHVLLVGVHHFRFVSSTHASADQQHLVTGLWRFVLSCSPDQRRLCERRGQPSQARSSCARGNIRGRHETVSSRDAGTEIRSSCVGRRDGSRLEHGMATRNGKPPNLERQRGHAADTRQIHANRARGTSRERCISVTMV